MIKNNNIRVFEVEYSIEKGIDYVRFFISNIEFISKVLKVSLCSLFTEINRIIKRKINLYYDDENKCTFKISKLSNNSNENFIPYHLIICSKENLNLLHLNLTIFLERKISKDEKNFDSNNILNNTHMTIKIEIEDKIIKSYILNNTIKYILINILSEFNSCISNIRQLHQELYDTNIDNLQSAIFKNNFLQQLTEMKPYIISKNNKSKVNEIKYQIETVIEPREEIMITLIKLSDFTTLLNIETIIKGYINYDNLYNKYNCKLNLLKNIKSEFNNIIINM